MSADARPWAHLITREAVQDIHSDCIAQFGGDSTPQAREGCVEASIGAAWTAELYAGENESGGLCFAGSLLYYLVKNHCFVDGNKRVGWAACMEVLRSLGITVNATDDEIEALVTGIASGRSSERADVEQAVDVTTWLAPRLQGL